MVIYSENEGYKTYSDTQGVYYNRPQYKGENLELLICHDGNNKAHCKMRNLQAFFDIVPPSVYEFDQINHGISGIYHFFFLTIQISD